MSPADEAKLEALRDLEFDLHAIRVMTDIAANLVADVFQSPESHLAITKQPDTWLIPERQLEGVVFSINHAHEMVRAVESRFLAILGGDRESSEEVHP